MVYNAHARFRAPGEAVMRKFQFFFVFLMFSLSCLGGCDEKKYHTLPPIDSGVDADTDTVADVVVPPDEIDADEDGPDIVITAPLPDQTLYGENFQVRATIVPTADPLNYDSVTAFLNGVNYAMTVDTTVPNGFKITVNLSALPEGANLIRVTARDINGRLNFADVNFIYDRGPSIAIYSPTADGRYHGGVNISLKVSDNDGVIASSVTAVTANRDLTLTLSNEASQTANGHPVWIEFTGTIIFNDSMFNPPLSGAQRMTVTATNAVDNQGSASVDFTVDNQGPEIVIVSHVEGQIIGSITQIQATITDPAGVLSSSVFAVIGNDDLHFTVQLRAPEGSNDYFGSFDTTMLPNTFIWPALQVFASDMLGNETSVAFQLALDNGSPIISLDPPETMRLAKKNTVSQIECSRVFDPVGWASANDRELVPQVFWLRARVEDQGNRAVGAAWSPLALVNPASVEIFILDDTSQALAVDKNGDGICNDINPNLIPTINITGDPRETLKLNMVPLDPAGAADYRFVHGQEPELPCEAWGIATDPPDPLCPVVDGDLDLLLWYTYDKTEPAIYGLPPFSATSPLTCSGIQFDARANNISEGWACILVKAIDNVGNVGVSAPLRVCIDYNPYDLATPFECLDLFNAPDCTGTWDPGTSTVLSTPCIPMEFPDFEVRRED